MLDEEWAFVAPYLALLRADAPAQASATHLVQGEAVSRLVRRASTRSLRNTTLPLKTNEQERAQVGELCRQVQEITGQTVEVGFANQGYTGEEAAYAAAVHAIDLHKVKKPEGKAGFVLLHKRWIVERSFAWLRRFRRLGRD